MSTHLILLAAGEGSRMLSDRAKVLHEIGSAPLFAHALKAAEEMADGRKVVVVGHDGASVAKAAEAIDPEIRIAEQREQLGTAHAVLAASDAMAGIEGAGREAGTRRHPGADQHPDADRSAEHDRAGHQRPDRETAPRILLDRIHQFDAG